MVGPSSRPIPENFRFQGGRGGTGTRFQNQDRDGTGTETKGTAGRKNLPEKKELGSLIFEKVSWDGRDGD